MRLTRLIAFLSSLLLFGGLVVFGASSAASAAGCSGWGCHGRDPSVEGCSASSTLQAPAKVNGTTLAIVQNRFAGNCNSNWARAELATAGLNAHDSFIIDIFTTDSRGDFEYMCYPVVPSENGAGDLQESCSGATFGGSGFAFSDMVDGTNSTTADVYVYNSNGVEITSASATQ